MLVNEGRRQFLVTNLSAGFALAVSPVTAATITTDTNGLEAGEIQIPTQDGGMIPGYRAVPKSGTKHPAVLVVQEIFGVHEHIKDLCRRLAKDGYLAVATEYYARIGDLSKMTDVATIFKEVINKTPDGQMMSDMDSTAAWAAKNKGSATKLAIRIMSGPIANARVMTDWMPTPTWRWTAKVTSGMNIHSTQVTRCGSVSPDSVERR